MSCENGKCPYFSFILSKSPYLTAHIKIKYETVCFGRFSEKAQKFIFMELVSSFQPLSNFTKNLNIGAVLVLNPNTISHPEIYTGNEIKYCRTVACNFHRLMNCLNYSSDCIFISYPISWSTPRFQFLILRAC